ncbi:MAG TPA: methylmalonyl Co-A mutase-associated GTPase MeaB [Nakamurella sp.]|nr:methylmalonyl Co-A mutase-associated GTPase MeaB [Nakamurella sp.]
MTVPVTVPGPTAGELVAAARAGGVRAIARLLSRVERGGASAAEVAAALTGLARDAEVIGITGAPGAGKSTLTAALLRELRAGTGDRPARTVAVLAVDPSSPFSGGALLGDRVRMADHVTDAGVFIRSMSSRGHLGGLSAATPAAVDLMAALGFDVVIIETVGVGQSEVDVMHLADTVAVVLAPGMGDGVQAAKAGIMEIADLLVVNKADHEGAAATIRELKGMVALGRSGTAGPGSWRIPVLSTVATAGTGVPELVAALAEHRGYLQRSGELAERRRRRAGAAVEAVVLERIRRVLSGPGGQAQLAAAAGEVTAGRTDHHRAAQDVLDWLRAPAG